jgi:hypothetical protein
MPSFGWQRFAHNEAPSSDSSDEEAAIDAATHLRMHVFVARKPRNSLGKQLGDFFKAGRTTRFAILLAFLALTETYKLLCSSEGSADHRVYCLCNA